MQLTQHTFSLFEPKLEPNTSDHISDFSNNEVTLNKVNTNSNMSRPPYFVRYQDFSLFIAFDKRTGMRTHKVNENQWGLVETLSTQINTQLWVVHRLDKETSGVILFAKNKETAATLGQLFESQSVKKTYYFLTDQDSKQKSFTVKSHIEKQEHQFINNPHKEANSETQLEFVKKISDSVFLWKAEPKTGKPHQIRLHAELSQIPILGDQEHGGEPFFRLALHASQIEFTLNDHQYKIESPLPFCFEHETTWLGPWVESEWQDLNRHYPAHLYADQTYRVYHRQHHTQDVKIDKYGSIFWIYWYKQDPPTETDLLSLNEFCLKNNFKYILRHMLNRGHGVSGLEQKTLYFTDAPEVWMAHENSSLVELRKDQGFSPGLFLDQRNNRKFISQNAKNKSVLNLFSYTSIFSVVAANGGATKVTTVDASSAFLNWSKENFKHNQLQPEQHEFFMQDSLLFLQGSIKRQRQWDIIICDPPSFGRTKTTTWKIEKNLPELIQLMWSCLNKNGLILFTCNYEQWSLVELENQFKKALKGKSFKIENLPIPDLDFEFFDGYDNLLKGFIIKK